jgi:hypothetical protein
MKLFFATIAIGLLAVGAAHAENRFETHQDPKSGAKFGTAIMNASGQIAPAVTCKENGKGSINVVFAMPKTYVGSGKTVVDVRFDNSKAIRVFGTAELRSVYVVHVKPNSPEAAVLVGLKTAKHMALETWDAAGTRYFDDFDLGDAATLVQQAIDTCGDTNWQ